MATPEERAGVGFEIRPVAAAEVDQAGEVVLAAYRSLPGSVLGDGYGTDLRNVRARTTGATVLVAVDGDRVLGCVTLVDDPASPWSESLTAGEIGIRMLGVDPAAAARGVGSALVIDCLARGRAKGAARAVLHTTKDIDRRPPHLPPPRLPAGPGARRGPAGVPPDGLHPRAGLTAPTGLPRQEPRAGGDGTIGQRNSGITFSARRRSDWSDG
ncbi:MAG: GNAT family N-acetyltransferase [Acidimicrobiales bacterium]